MDFERYFGYGKATLLGGLHVTPCLLVETSGSTDYVFPIAVQAKDEGSHTLSFSELREIIHAIRQDLEEELGSDHVTGIGILACAGDPESRSLVLATLRQNEVVQMRVGTLVSDRDMLDHQVASPEQQEFFTSLLHEVAAWLSWSQPES